MKVLKIVPHSWKFLNNHENICIVCKSGLFHIILNSLSIILSQFSLLSKHTNNKNEIETAGKGGRVSKIYWNLLICGDNVDKMREKWRKSGTKGNKNRDLKSKLSGCSIGTSRTDEIEQNQNESRVWYPDTNSLISRDLSKNVRF